MKSDTHIQIRITKEAKQEAEEAAEEVGLSVSSYIKMLMKADIKKRARRAKS